MGNLGILGGGFLLIIAVLFIGYRMDTASDGYQKPYKEPKQRKPKEQKAKVKKSKVADEYKEEYTDKEEADIYKNENLSDMPYETDYNEHYETDYVPQNELSEESEYEEDDIGIFEEQDVEDSTFNNDIDDEITFGVQPPRGYEEPTDFKEVEEFEEEEVDEIPEDDDEYEYVEVEVDENGNEIVVEDDEEDPYNFKEVVVEEEPEPEPEPKAKKRGRPKKSKKAKEPIYEEIVVEDEPAVEDDFSSTMIFDTDKLNGELDAIDDIENRSYAAEAKATSEEFEYSAPVNMDAQIDGLDDDTRFSPPPVETEYVDGPFQPTGNEAENFMNEINRYKEESEADDFSGFSVETKDAELKEISSKYSKKKTEQEILDMDGQISIMPDKNKDEEKSDMDMGFLAEMEKNLKQNQEKRNSKKKKK